MFYTSYFGNLKNIDIEKCIVATICLYRPTWLRGTIENWSFLAPSTSLLTGYKAGTISEEEYTVQYKQQLNNAKKLILSEFEYWSRQNKDVVMLCYESPDKFCHRHILAEWLIENNIPCEELKK